MIMWHLL